MPVIVLAWLQHTSRNVVREELQQFEEGARGWRTAVLLVLVVLLGFSARIFWKRGKGQLEDSLQNLTMDKLPEVYFCILSILAKADLRSNFYQVEFHILQIWSILNSIFYPLNFAGLGRRFLLHVHMFVNSNFMKPLQFYKSFVFKICSASFSCESSSTAMTSFLRHRQFTLFGKVLLSKFAY